MQVNVRKLENIRIVMQGSYDFTENKKCSAYGPQNVRLNFSEINYLFVTSTSRKGFFNICAAIWMFDLCLMYLINGALPELISDDRRRGRFACVLLGRFELELVFQR